MSNVLIRTLAVINALIDALNTAAEQPGAAPVNGAELNLLTLEARAATAIEKFEKAKRESEAQERVRGISQGDAVTFVYGRAVNKRIVSGNVLAAAEGKTGLQFNVLVGEGIESTTVLVGADALLLDADDIAAAETQVAADVAEAKAKADAEAAKKQS